MTTVRTHKHERTIPGIHTKIDQLLNEPIKLNRLLQYFNWIERPHAERYLTGLIEDGRVTAEKVYTGKRGRPATILTRA